MIRFFRATAVIALSAGLMACGTTTPTVGSAGSRWLSNPVVYGDGENQNAAEKKGGMAEIYFYRHGKGTPLPVNVYVNHAYLASLLHGGYAKSSLCSGEVLISAAEDDASNRHVTRTIPGLPVVIEPGKARYFAVVEDAKGVQSIVPSDADKAAAAGVKLQRHTIPRLPLECNRDAAGVPATKGAASPASPAAPATPAKAG